MIEKRFQREIMDDLSLIELRSAWAGRLCGKPASKCWALRRQNRSSAHEEKTFCAQLRFYPMPNIELPDIKSLKFDDGKHDPRDQISLKLLELVSLEIPDGLVQDELAFDGIDGSPSGARSGRRHMTR